MAIAKINYILCESDSFYICLKICFVLKCIFAIYIEVKYPREIFEFAHSVKRNHSPHTLGTFRAIASIF